VKKAGQVLRGLHATRMIPNERKVADYPMQLSLI
jgi:hypothetical protein